MRAILAGGGTGGHVIPALAIARELTARYGAELLFIGTPRGIESKLVPAAGFELKLIQVGALKNVSLATRLRTITDLPSAIFACRRIIQEFRPGVVIGVGGYASGPGMLAAWLGGIPTLAFEPNLVPGLANRLIARRVSAAAVHFEETARYFRNTRVTGVPVRQEFFQIAPRTEDTKPTLLVFGGSQGAKAINRAVMDSFPLLHSALPEVQIIHQTGERDLTEVQAAVQRSQVPAEVSAFIIDMSGAFARADLLLCRSGASTVAEVTAAGKPAIFVPFPRAADDHQMRNARALEQEGAAVVLPESELTPAKLAETVGGLFADRAKLKAMSEATRRLAHPRATREIAEMAATLAGAAG